MSFRDISHLHFLYIRSLQCQVLVPPDRLARPGLGVDQVAGASGAEGRELRQVASMVLCSQVLGAGEGLCWTKGSRPVAMSWLTVAP